jgi:NAD(P)-dependent dehydrogenase (short-subunit alcohol dehydrogenase family)
MSVYCITGTNRGIGLEYVRQLTQDPNNTIFALTRSLQRDNSKLESLCGGSDATTHILECDTGDVASVEVCCTKIIEILKSSNQKIDVLINNAAVNLKSGLKSLEIVPDLLMRSFSINVVGPAVMVKSLAAGPVLSSSVRVVNMTSGLASMQETLGMARNCCMYSISKAALNMLSIHQSGDLRTKAGLKEAVVILMDPGWTKTDMGGPRAVLEPEESIGSMLKIIGGLKADDNGKFYRYEGNQVRW